MITSPEQKTTPMVVDLSLPNTDLLAGDTRERYRERLARITLDSIVQFVGLLDAKGTVLEINQMALDAVGIKLSDVEGKPFWTTFWWQVSDEINATLRESIQRASQGEFVRWDTPIFGRAGGTETIIIDASLMPVRDEQGNVVFIAAEGRDITEKKAYEREIARQREELAQLDKLKTQFFTNISHEFRTPLTLMLGPLEDTLAQSTNLAAEDRQRLQVAQRNSQRLLKLVNTLLDFSCIEAGHIQASYEPTDLAIYTAELASSFRSAIEHAGLRFIINCLPLSEPIYLDREMWGKIIFNLLSNAFKFTYEGEIEVSLRQTDAGVELTVRDTGTGIPAEELPHIFERFHRVEGAQCRTMEGSGIGLALVQELVKLHGGRLRVNSQVNSGSTFSITLPLGSVHLPAERISGPRPLASTATDATTHVGEALHWLPQTAMEPKQSNPKKEGGASMPASELKETVAGTAPQSSPRLKVLLADDNADMRNYVHRLLSQQYEVVAVNNGAAALQAARQGSFDLVLADIMMPRLDGFGLLQALRADERLKAIPVILLSARAGEESRIEGLAAGADDYLVKPFSARELLARVEAHLRLQRVQRESEAALWASEKKFSAAFEQSPLALTITSLATGQLVEVNESFVRLSGYTREEALGHTPEELRLWVEPAQRSNGLARLQAGEHALGFEARFRTKNGAQRVGVIGVTLVEINSQPHVLSSVADITERKQAEEALRAREAQLQILFDEAPLGIYLIDADFRIQRVNPKARAAFGNIPDLIGRDFDEVLHLLWAKDYADEIASRFRHTLETGEPYFVPERIKKQQDRDVIEYYEWQINRIPLPDGRYGVVCHFRNISERKRAEQAREQAEGRNRFLVRLDDAIRPLDDPDEITLTAARILGEHLGVDRCAYADIEADEDTMNLRGNYLRTPDIQSIVGRLRFADFGAEVLQLMRKDKPYVVNDVDTHAPPVGDLAAYRATQIQAVICVPLHKNGKFVAAMAVHTTTPRNWSNNEVELVREVAARCWESIERARVARVLRDREERFRMLANNMSQLAWTCDELGRATWYNQRWYEYTGCTWEQMQDDGWQSVHHPDHLERVIASLQHSFATGEDWEDTFPLRGKDGKYCWFLSRAIPIRDLTGRIICWFGTNTDVTQQRAAEEALREADRRKDEFLAMLAHELRNPLAPIRNAAQVLKLIGPADANLQRAREVIERQTQHLTRLVDDLLDVSRITQGKVTLQREPLELSLIIQRAVETSRPLIDARRHQLIVALPPDPVPVEGDLTRLIQIVGNLLNNAAKYTDEGGRICVEAAEEEGQAVIRVRDNGAGLSANLLPHVFDLFTQAERSLDRSQGGLGIGLTLVRRLVELHGGEVEACSDGPNQGSEFIVRLPVKTLITAPNGEKALRTSAQFGRSKLRILVVEDNADSAEMMAFVLKLGGHEVHLADDGPEALNAAVTLRPQVILCDIGLPKMDGYELVAQLRAQTEFKRTRIIALSGYGQEEDRRRARDVGFDYHLTKPVDPETLEALLESLQSNEDSL